MFALIVAVLLVVSACTAFSPVPLPSSIVGLVERSHTQLRAIDDDSIDDIGYTVRVQKPMGLIFGENKDPYYGLVVDDVAEAQNGAVAGIRVGDQLMYVNGQNAIGRDFDTVMGYLTSGPSQLELRFYRGTVGDLFTIISNRASEGDSVDPVEIGDEEVVMDENYESPVKIEVKERKPLGIGDVFKAMKKVGEIMTESDEPAQKAAPQKKGGGGFFGIGGETIQLDGDDANTLK